MPLFVLLLKPKVKKFELIQFQRIPEGATVGGVLGQLSQLASHAEFQTQVNIGLYCYKTRTQLILPQYNDVQTKTMEGDGGTEDDTLLLPDTPNSASSPRSNDGRLSDVSGILTEQEVAATKPTTENKGISVVDNPQDQPALSSSNENFVNGEVSSSKKQEGEGVASSAAIANDAQISHITSSPKEEDSTLDYKETKSQVENMNLEPSSSLTPSTNNNPSEDEDTTDISPAALTVSTSLATEDNENEAEQEEWEDPVLDLEAIGNLLVAIPEGYQFAHVLKQAEKIVESPAFRLLTQGNDFLDEPAKSTTEQELEKLQQQKVTQQVSHHLQTQVSQNEELTAIHQQQQEDLEQRRRNQRESLFEKQQASPKAVLLSPDAHGLSPLDAMRVAQNQQKAAARQQERATLQQYQRHSDTSGRLSVTSNTRALAPDATKEAATSLVTAKSSTPPAVVMASVESSTTPQVDLTTAVTTTTEQENDSPPSPSPMFVPSSVARRQSLEQQKQAELDAIRNQGILAKTVTKAKSAYFVPEESLSSQNRTQTQRDNELAGISQQGIAKSWRGPLSSPPTSPNPVTPKGNRSVRAFVTTKRESVGVSTTSVSSNSAHASSSARTSELEELRKQGLTKAKGATLQEIPVLEKRSSQTMSSSFSELEQLKGLGLTKSLKTQYADTTKVNQEQSEAYQAQQRDLDQRKAKTKAFQVSRNSALSAADAAQLNYSKQKKEGRVKEREAMGYYQSYRGEHIGDNDQDNKEWKKTGKVHTTTGTAPTTTTMEWEAPTEGDKMEVSKPPTFTTTTTSISTGTTKAQSPTVAEGACCACIIL